MQSTSFIGLAVALGAGVMAGIQATLFTLIGRAIGAGRASLILNLLGGILAGIIVLAAIGIQGREQWNIPRSALVSAVISVALGMLIITGFPFHSSGWELVPGLPLSFWGRC